MVDTTVRFVFEDKGGSGGTSGGGGGGTPTTKPKPAAAGTSGTGKTPVGTDFDEAVGSALESLDKLRPALENLPVVGKSLKGIFDFLEETGKSLGGLTGPTPTESAGKAAGPSVSGGAQPKPVVTAPKPTPKPAPAATSGAASQVVAGAAGQAAGVAATSAVSGGAGVTSGAAVVGAGASVTSGAIAAGGGAGAAGGAAGAAALLGPVGLAVIGLVAVVGASVVATKLLIRSNEKLREQFKERARQFAPFSREIQVQQVQSEVAQLRQDIEFARRLGPRTAQFNEAEDRLARAVDRISLAIDEIKLNSLTPIIELVAKGAENVAEVAQAVAIVNTLFDNGFKKIISVLSLSQKGDERERNKIPPEADILGAFNREPDLNVEWNGEVFGDDEKLGRNLIRGARFDGLPEIALP